MSDALRSLTPDGFTEYMPSVYHCERCHRLVRTYEADNTNDALAMLRAHEQFNCIIQIDARRFDV